MNSVVLDLLESEGNSFYLEEGRFYYTHDLNAYLGSEGVEPLQVISDLSIEDLLSLVLSTLDSPETVGLREYFYEMFNPDGNLAVVRDAFRDYFRGERSSRVEFLLHIIAKANVFGVLPNLEVAEHMLRRLRPDKRAGALELIYNAFEDAVLTFSEHDYFYPTQSKDDVILREARLAAGSVERMRWLIHTDTLPGLLSDYRWCVRTLYTCIVLCESADLSQSRSDLTTMLNAMLSEYTIAVGEDRLHVLYENVLVALSVERGFDTHISYLRRSLILTEEVCGGSLVDLSLEYEDSEYARYVHMLFEEDV